MSHRVLLLALLAIPLTAQERASSCSNCAAWNQPQQGFRIYGNSYYVGTRGLASILITSPSGHVLIDGALAESAPRIVANVHALGFRVEDIRLILSTHVHFDHAGGIAELQKLSGARVAASTWSADVLKKGDVARDDPQFGTIRPVARVAHIETFEDGATLRAGDVSVTAHLTPGHTPGGTSWTWQSCEKDRCLNLVYADSLTPVSADGFLFSRRPHGVEDFEQSYRFLDGTPCDILITPHPGFSNLWERLEQRKSNPDALVDSGSCRRLAESSRALLKERLAKERALR